jgi:hypothetical protein
MPRDEPSGTHTYQATVRVRTAGGTAMLVRTTVRASDPYRAKLLLAAQYGADNVISTPQRC